MADDGIKDLTEEEAVARGWRPIRALIPAAEAESGTAPTGPADDISANKADAADTPKSGSERTQEYRERAKETRKLAQLNILTTTDLQRREILKALGKEIIRDGVAAVCDMAVRAATDQCRLDAMQQAGEAPDIVYRGIEISNNDDVRAAVDAVMQNSEIRNLVLAFLTDKNGLLSLCSAIFRDVILKQAAYAAKARSGLAKIVAGMAESPPEILETIAAAIKRPRATALGYAILSFPGRRGEVLRWILTIVLRREHFSTIKQASKP
jgi:DNA-binding NarL/FixJ family response regulator